MMKNIPVFAASIIFCACQGYSQVNLHNGLQGYYPFSGNAKDMSGNGHDATVYVASLSADRTGKGNSAYYFNGSASINDTAFSTASFGAMSFAAWIKSDKISPRSTIIQQGGGVMYTNLFTGRKMVTAFDGTGNNNSSSNESGSDVVNGTWMHVVATNDGTTTKQYVNGVLESTYPETYKALANGLFIGLQINGQWGFTGYIDEVYIYNRALNDAEAAALYTGGVAGIAEGDLADKDLLVYPNPAKGREIYLEGEEVEVGSVLTLTTMAGRQVYYETLPTGIKGNKLLNLEGLKAGIYIVNLRTGQASVTRRIVLL